MDDEAGGAPPMTPPETMEEGQPMTPPEAEASAGEAMTALIPKSVLGGMEFEPGQELTVKVVKVYGDEIEVQPVTSTETETEPMSADQEIDDMDAASVTA